MQWKYRSINQFREDLPTWIDSVFEKATHPVVGKRYQAMSEFTTDLATPNPLLIKKRAQAPLLERDPVTFWKGLSLLLFLVVIIEFVFLNS